jgi:hypothetical protein
MKLDMDKYRAAMSPLTVRIDGVDYTATSIVGFNDAVRIQGKVAEDLTGEKVVEAVRELCTLTGLPADPILALPVAAIKRVLEGFFVSANQSPEGEE